MVLGKDAVRLFDHHPITGKLRAMSTLQRKSDVKATLQDISYVTDPVDNTTQITDAALLSPLAAILDMAVGDTVGQLRYMIDNHLGSIETEWDRAGAPLRTNRYTAYGEPSVNLSHACEATRFGSSGQEQDGDLLCFGARYYAPEIARWISADQAGGIDGMNL